MFHVIVVIFLLLDSISFLIFFFFFCFIIFLLLDVSGFNHVILMLHIFIFKVQSSYVLKVLDISMRDSNISIPIDA